MREIDTLMAEVEKWRKEGKKGALATVINVKGSAYRREGAKMLVDEKGETIGLISGGCLESDVAQFALDVMENNNPIIKTYDLSEDLVWGLGLGCPGTVTLLIEPLRYDEPSFLANMNSFKEGKEGVLISYLHDSGKLERMFVSRDEQIGSLGSPILDKKAIEMSMEKLKEGNPKSETQFIETEKGEHVFVFFDVHIPKTELIIFGAGHDAIPLAQFAHLSGIDTVVVDQRESFNNEERFPYSKRMIARSNQLNEKVNIGPRTFVVIMNHHMERDKDTLKFALQSKARYVGLLGPHSRKMRILDQLQEEGVHFTEEQLAKLHNPVGLDIGAVSPEEISISILAEIIAVRNGHEGGFLNGSEFIHKPTMKMESV